MKIKSDFRRPPHLLAIIHMDNINNKTTTKANKNYYYLDRNIYTDLVYNDYEKIIEKKNDIYEYIRYTLHPAPHPNLVYNTTYIKQSCRH